MGERRPVRQIEILQRVADGQTPQQAARSMRIARSTGRNLLYAAAERHDVRHQGLTTMRTVIAAARRGEIVIDGLIPEPGERVSLR